MAAILIVKGDVLWTDQGWLMYALVTWKAHTKYLLNYRELGEFLYDGGCQIMACTPNSSCLLFLLIKFY